MRRIRVSGRWFGLGAFAPIAAPSLLLLPLAGCGGGDDGGSVQVEQKQQRELQKLVTQDYGQMYKDRYKAGKSYRPTK